MGEAKREGERDKEESDGEEQREREERGEEGRDAGWYESTECCFLSERMWCCQGVAGEGGRVLLWWQGVCFGGRKDEGRRVLVREKRMLLL